jgi:uncharacterized membrane protein
MGPLRMEESVEIARPVEDVYAFLANIDSFSQWSGTVVDANRPATDALGVGHTFTLAQKFLGRRFDSPCEVTALEPNRRFGYRTIGRVPLPFSFDFTLEPSGSGTRVDVVVEGEPGSFVNLAGPLFERAGRRQLNHDLETMKDILEAGGEVNS